MTCSVGLANAVKTPLKRPNPQQYEQQPASATNTTFIKVITGVHRAGKLVLLKQYMQHIYDTGVPKNHSIYSNLEVFKYRNI